MSYSRRTMKRIFWAVAGLICLVALGISCSRPYHYRPTAVPAPQPPPPIAKPPAPKPVAEIRAVWVSDSTRLDWPSATAALQQAVFNTMYVNFASGGAALYPGSQVLPNVSTASPEDWRRGIELAHRRGIAVQAKLITFFMYKTPPDFQRKLINANRVMRGADGRPALQNGNTWLCPSNPDNRALLTATINEMISRYPVDGLHLDYIRYFEEPTCFCAHCRQAFQTATGLTVRRWPADVMGGALTDRFLQWKRDVINDSVREFAGAARAVRPGLTVSAAVFHDLDRGRQDRAQDWSLWLNRGWVNYVCTMSYTPDLRDFEMRVRKQQAWAPRNQVVVGIGSYKFKQQSEVWAQINLCRRLGAPGFALFSYDDCAARDMLPNLNAPAR